MGCCPTKPSAQEADGQQDGSQLPFATQTEAELVHMLMSIDGEGAGCPGEGAGCPKRAPGGVGFAEGDLLPASPPASIASADSMLDAGWTPAQLVRDPEPADTGTKLELALGPLHMPFDPTLRCPDLIDNWRQRSAAMGPGSERGSYSCSESFVTCAGCPQHAPATDFMDAKAIVALAHLSWAATYTRMGAVIDSIHQPDLNGATKHPLWGSLFKSFGWNDNATLVYLCSVLPVAHQNKAYKSIALRLLGRIGLGDHLGTPEDLVMLKLQAVAEKLTKSLCPTLLAHRAQQGLAATLGDGIQVPSALHGHHRIAASALSQKGHLALFDGAIAEHFNGFRDQLYG